MGARRAGLALRPGALSTDPVVEGYRTPGPLKADRGPTVPHAGSRAHCKGDIRTHVL